jgi:hypothetical protein
VDRQKLLKRIRPPVRLAYRLIGRGIYRKQFATLFPGRPIPQTP